MLLEHVGAYDLADKLRKAINAAINTDHARTPDLGGVFTTELMTQAILRRLE
jgi:isocitrate/isopropylmalate dehydrogenase